MWYYSKSWELINALSCQLNTAKLYEPLDFSLNLSNLMEDFPIIDFPYNLSLIFPFKKQYENNQWAKNIFFVVHILEFGFSLKVKALEQENFA
jgi:hypothetical protein